LPLNLNAVPVAYIDSALISITPEVGFPVLSGLFKVIVASPASAPITRVFTSFNVVIKSLSFSTGISNLAKYF
jgi:hypothetical protein